MNEKNIKLIVNPSSGNWRGKKILPAIIKELKSLGVNFEIELSGREKASMELARSAAQQGYKKIIAVGGDGTINEVVNGIIGYDVLFGLIPVGFGNDFARSFNFSSNIRKACATIAGNKFASIDVGKINNSYFINSAGFGFDGFVVYHALKGKAEGKSKIIDFLRYVKCTVRGVREYRGIDIKVKIDNEEMQKKVYMLVIGNNKYEAKGCPVIPDAKLDDGLFDLCVIDAMSVFDVIAHFPLVYFGKHTNSKYVKFYKASEITITSSDVIYGHADGESLQGREFHSKIFPGKLKILIP